MCRVFGNGLRVRGSDCFRSCRLAQRPAGEHSRQVRESVGIQYTCMHTGEIDTGKVCKSVRLAHAMGF